MNDQSSGAVKDDFITALRIIYREGLSDAFAHLSSRSEDGSRMMFMPQRPYLPLGTLRAAVSYPAPAR